MNTELTTPHRCDEDGRRRVRTHCLKCRSNVVLDFGELDDDGIRQILKRFATYGTECPGWHVELDMTHCWQLKAVSTALFTVKEAAAA